MVTSKTGDLSAVFEFSPFTYFNWTEGSEDRADGRSDLAFLLVSVESFLNANLRCNAPGPRASRPTQLDVQVHRTHAQKTRHVRDPGVRRGRVVSC